MSEFCVLREQMFVFCREVNSSYDGRVAAPYKVFF